MANGAAGIGRADLRPGDVLMSKGRGELSALIAELEGGLYSHASYWDGGRLVHATTGGVVTGSLADLLAEQEYVDVLRLGPRELAPYGELELGDPHFPDEAVTTAAHDLVGGPYDYGSIFLAALLLWEADWDTAMRAIRAAFPLARSAAIAKIHGWVRDASRATAAGTGKSAMTCTAVVTTSFWNAGQRVAAEQRDLYRLEFAIDRPRRAPWRITPVTDVQPLGALEPRAAFDTDDDADFRALIEECGRLVEGVVVDDTTEPSLDTVMLFEGLAQPRVVVAGSPDLPLNLVSPADFQRSPSFRSLGRLPA